MTDRFEETMKWSQQSGSVVRVGTTHHNTYDFDAVIVQLESLWVACRPIRDFESDGFMIVPRRHVREVTFGDFEKCATEVIQLAKESRPLHPVPAWLTSVQDMKGIFDALRTSDNWPAVELIYKGKASLYLGKIVNVQDDAAQMLCYDAAGCWESEYDLDFDEVFKIEFNSRYLEHFNLYMRTKDAQQSV